MFKVCMHIYDIPSQVFLPFSLPALMGEIFFHIFKMIVGDLYHIGENLFG